MVAVDRMQAQKRFVRQVTVVAAADTLVVAAVVDAMLASVVVLAVVLAAVMKFDRCCQCLVVYFEWLEPVELAASAAVVVFAVELIAVDVLLTWNFAVKKYLLINHLLYTLKFLCSVRAYRASNDKEYQ